jgi:alkanesulfonate monooxygenase SsuD/methylene tetrahydromethanopterin reductase-like flavin-dependent oxidoreductase (luciferase family)
MTPRLGIVFRPQFAPERLPDVARVADSSGIDELWLWEDCFDHGGVATAAAALASTERLAVGVGVLPAPLRNVALTAMEITTLARMFPDRVYIGVGHGVLDWMGQVGARVASPMNLLREYTEALQSLLAGERVTTDGRYVKLSDVALGWPSDPKPPVHVGAIKPRTLALAGGLADGLIVTGGTTPDDVADARSAFDAAWGQRPGRGRVTAYLMAITGPDAERRYENEIARWGLREERGDLEFGAHGDAAAIAAAVRRWADAGTDTVVLQPGDDDDPVTYARFAGEQVRPLLD